MGFYIHKDVDSSLANFYSFGLRIDEDLCQPNIESPLPSMYIGTQETRNMFNQLDLSTYITNCSNRPLSFGNLPVGVTDNDYTLTFNNG